MVELRFKLFAWLCVAFCYNFIRSTTAGDYVCKGTHYYGYCKLYEDCPALQDTDLTYDMINWKNCKYSGLSGPVVCCPRRTIRQRFNGRTTKSTTTTTTTTTTKRTMLPKRRSMRYTLEEKTNIGDLQKYHPVGLALLNKPNCGTINDIRVANGIDAMQGEFPWMAMLLYARREPLCGGSVITERFVLTAAHCIKDDLQLVRLGEHRISTKEDCVLHICQTHVDFGIDPRQKPIIHPEYTSFNYHKDIALIKLDRDINFRLYNHIAPICLPTKPSDYDISSHENLTLTGWGLQNYDRSVDVLQKGLLTIKPLDLCKKLYPRLRVEKSKLCIQAGSNHAVSCHGDSGGPLFWKAKYQSGRFTRKHYTQIGLVSLGYGKECGDLTSEPFMYENVTDSMIWITHALYKAQFDYKSNVPHYFYPPFRRF